MKIDLNSPAASLLPVDQSPKQISNSGSASVQGATQDRTTLQTGSHSVQALTSQALNSPEIRQDKVDALRQSVSSGNYHADATETAGAIIDSESE